MKNNSKKLVETALCVALGIILPQALHAIPNVGTVFSPMHIPVLLCGLICGWTWGLACGVATPLLSSLLFTMPPMAYLPGMLLELAAYGLLAGFLYRKCKLNIYLSLVLAMLLGRVAYGLMQTIIFVAGGQSYSFSVFFTTMFVTGLPGIIVQIIIIPILVLGLQKAKISEKPKKLKNK